MHDEPYRQVPLYRRDGSVRGIAVVDVEDYAELVQFRWHLNSNGYAVRPRAPGSTDKTLMHRQILGLVHGDGLEGDHINRDKLDNRRSNLRVLTHGQNQQNRTVHRHSRSRFRGVKWDASKRRWRPVGSIAGKQRYLGGAYRTEIEAAQVAEAWRRENMPFAQPDPALEAALREHPALF